MSIVVSPLEQVILILNSIAIYILVGVVGLRVLMHRRSRLLDFFMTLGLSAVITEGLKYVVNRPRPPFGIELGFEGSGFPSTHTGIAFAAAFFWILVCQHLSQQRSGGVAKVSTASEEGKLFMIGVIAGAVVVGVLRVLSGAHYPIDVIVGAIIGILSVIPFRYYDVTARRAV